MHSGDVIADGIRPNIDVLSIESSNPYNSSIVGPGDSVTLTLSASENLLPPYMNIFGESVSPLGSGINWSATRVLTNDDEDGLMYHQSVITDLVGELRAEFYLYYGW